MEAEVLQPGTDGATVGEMVAQGATVLRIENETMMAVAKQRPRDESRVIKACLSELDLAPENAAAAYYSIPYRDRQPDGSVKITKVEGPSIKAAMSLARRWGNCTVGSRVMHEDAEAYDIEGVFIDFETAFRCFRPFRVSKFQKRRGGRVERMDPQRELMTLQAGASKAMRNAALAALPDYLVAAYLKRAREIVGGKLDVKADQKQIDAALRIFAKRGVTQEQLERKVDCPAANWTGNEIADLRGLWNALEDGQVTIDEAFGGAEPEAGTGPVNIDQAVTARAETEQRPDNAEPPAAETKPGTDATPRATTGAAGEKKGQGSLI